MNVVKTPRSGQFLLEHPRDLIHRHPPLPEELGSLPDVPGRTHRKDAFIAAGEQHPFQKPTTLIVKKILIPFAFHKLGYDHDDAASRMLFRKVENELNDGNNNETVG